MGAGRALATAGGGLGKGGLSAVAQAAGAVAQGGMAGIAAKAAGAGLAFKAATGAAGAGQAALSGLSRKAAAPAQKMGDFLKSNFQQGQLREHARQSSKAAPNGASPTTVTNGSAATVPPPTTARGAQSAPVGDSLGTLSIPSAAAGSFDGGGVSETPLPTNGDRRGLEHTPAAIASTAKVSPPANQARHTAKASNPTDSVQAAHPPASGASAMAPPNVQTRKKTGTPADLITMPAEFPGSDGRAVAQQGGKAPSQLAHRALDQVRQGDGGGGSVQVNLPSHDE